MQPNAPRRIPATLDVIPLSAPLGGIAEIGCARCDDFLDLHQPSAEDPGRLLGVCRSCGQWVLMVLDSDRSELVICLLPDGEGLVAASRAREPIPPSDGEGPD